MKNISQTLTIAIVSDAVYPYNIGGKEKRIYEITKRLVKKGHRVTIYCMKWWKEEASQVRHEGVTYEAISPYYPLYTENRRSIKEGILFALHTFKLLTKKFDVIDIDHMPQLVLFPTKVVCLLKDKKMIATWHEVWGKTLWKSYLGKTGVFAYIIEKMSVRFPNIIISGSQHTADRLQFKLGRKNNVFAVPNGIDTEEMNNVKPAKKSYDIVFAGRFLAHKNVPTLIKAVKELTKKYPHLTCLIIGNGPEEIRLKRLANRLQIESNVKFMGFMEDHITFYSYIKAAKMFVLPSSREGFGIATVEALALGVPVITYDHPQNGSRNLIIDGKNGYLFNDKKRKLSEAINLVLNKKLKSASVKATVRQYDWNRIVDQIEEIYKR